ncbi:MAG: hypothetical protein U0N90_01270, partial [Blautia sp.]
IIKSALRSDAHSHERQMSAKADHARRSKSVLLGRKWNCEGVRSTLLFSFLSKKEQKKTATLSFSLNAAVSFSVLCVFSVHFPVRRFPQ